MDHSFESWLSRIFIAMHCILFVPLMILLLLNGAPKGVLLSYLIFAAYYLVPPFIPIIKHGFSELFSHLPFATGIALLCTDASLGMGLLGCLSSEVSAQGQQSAIALKLIWSWLKIVLLIFGAELLCRYVYSKWIS